MPPDPWFDEDGDTDFEEIQEDMTFFADLTGVSQRGKANQQRAKANQQRAKANKQQKKQLKKARREQKTTNKLLKAQIAEQERINDLPQCSDCGGPIPKRGLKVCMHCNGKLRWQKVGGTLYTPEEAVQEKKRLAKARRRAAEEKEEQEREARNAALQQREEMAARKKAKEERKKEEKAKEDERNLRVSIYGEEAVSKSEAALKKLDELEYKRNKWSNNNGEAFSGVLGLGLVLSVAYGAFALFVWTFNFGFAWYQSIPNWLHYSILLGPVAAFCLEVILDGAIESVLASRKSSLTLAIPESARRKATPAETSTYYVRRQHKVFGPYNVNKIETAIRSGQLEDTDVFSEQFNGPWATLKNLYLTAEISTYAIKRPFYSKKSRVTYSCPRCEAGLMNYLAEAGNHDSCPECGISFSVPGPKELTESDDR